MENEYRKPTIEVIGMAEDAILTSQQFMEPDPNEVGLDWEF